jgi:hypothetical protein
MQCPEDPGFPFCAMPHQTFRLKVTLRKLEDLVVCSDETKVKPAPWNVPLFRYTALDSTVQTFSPQSVLSMGPPKILLATIQRYLPQDAQRILRETPQTIPFRRTFENVFTFGELDYAPLDRGGVASVTRRIDARHPTERLYWVFRSSVMMDHNRLDDFTNDYFTTHPPTVTQPYPTGDINAYYYQLKLLIAGKEREHLSTPLTWEPMESLAKDERGQQIGVGSMRWSLGDRYGTLYPAARQPEGTVNFTSADRPTLYLELANVETNPRLAQRVSEMRVWLEGWNVYEVREGRGRMMFAN